LSKGWNFALAFDYFSGRHERNCIRRESEWSLTAGNAIPQSSGKLTMRYILFWFAVLAASASTFAQDQGGATSSNAPDREALLKAAVARDRGEITALEPLTGAGQGIVVGHSSGAVLNCYGENTCREFGGTPNIAVEHIAVSRRGALDVVWVSYPRGALYQCIKTICKRFIWSTSLDE